MANSTVPFKVTGNLVTAAEINDIVSAINSKADANPSASAITTGTLDNARLSAQVVITDSNGILPALDASNLYNIVKDAASGVRINANDEVILGGILEEPAEIEVGNHFVSFTSPLDTITNSNYFRIDKSSIEGFWQKPVASNLVNSFWKVTADEFYFTNVINSEQSSVIYVNGNFSVLNSTDVDGNTVKVELDNTTGATAILSYSTTGNASGKGIYISSNVFKMGFSSVGEDNFVGLEFDNTGKVLLTGNTPTSSATDDVVVLKGTDGTLKVKAINEIGGGDLVTVYNAKDVPTAPTNGLKLFTRRFAQEFFLAIRSAFGHQEIQPHFGFSRATILDMNWGSTTFSNIGTVSPTTAGTISSNTPALTNYLTQMRRVTYTTDAVANSVAGARNLTPFLTRGNGPRRGGFFVQFKFGLPIFYADSQIFVGLRQSTTALTATVSFPTLMNTLCVVKETGDTNLFFLANDGTGTGAKINTGITPTNTTAYRFTAFCRPNDTVVYVTLEDLDASTYVTGTFAEASYTTNAPDPTAFMTWYVHISNGAAASAAAIDFGGIVFNTNY